MISIPEFGFSKQKWRQTARQRIEIEKIYSPKSRITHGSPAGVV
jgi:hypothetical protein